LTPERAPLTPRAIAPASALPTIARATCAPRLIEQQPLGNIGRRNEQADRKYVRRPLTENELRLLILETRQAPDWRGMTGADRSWFYILGAVTGFRRSELGALRPEDFDIEGPTPTVSLAGSSTKNGKAAEQPLPVGVAAELGPWLASKAAGRPVFALPEKTALMLHGDLERCRIEPVDAQGRVVDTHSLRHGFISALARAGVPLKVAQTLARHSDPKLTMNFYSHLTAFDLHGAIADALPDLTFEPAENLAAATGTHGPTATQNAALPEGSRRNIAKSNEVMSNRPMTLKQPPALDRPLIDDEPEDCVAVVVPAEAVGMANGHGIVPGNQHAAPTYRAGKLSSAFSTL
jgi:hypothetical protein